MGEAGLREIKPINPTAASGEGVIKGSFPQYREGAEMPGVASVLKISKALSHESKIKLKSESGNIQASDRTLALRRVRRELMGKVKNTQNTEERRDFITQGHARDELAEQFMSGQEEVLVDLGDLGEQMARFVVLTPLKSRSGEVQSSKPPIFILPGISNDLESTGMLAQEAAFLLGRDVVLIGFPESWHGEATDAFGRATEESTSYEPHTAFFKKAIENIRAKQNVQAAIGNPSEIELWGYSTGAAIVAEILTDPQYREQVANAVIIAPPSCVDQKNLKILGQEIPLPTAMIRELLQNVRPKNIKDTAKLNVTNRRDIQYTEDHRKRMLRTYNALREKVLRKNNWWKNDLKVKAGGRITVVSYDSDRLTRSYEVVDQIAQNPNLSVVELHGGHNNALTKPEILIDAVNKIAVPDKAFPLSIKP